jgi:hypothetical protein
MALRNASDIGVRDVRRFSDLQTTDTLQRADSPVRAPRTRAPKPPRQALAAVPPNRETGAQTEPEALSRPLLGDEPQVHLQAAVPDVVLQRMKVVSFELAEDRRHLRRHQTILGGLVWQYVDHTDQRKLDELADLVDAYLAGPWHGLPEDRRLGARIPTSLKRRADGALLSLAHSRRNASARVLLAALVWRHVVSREDDSARFASLVDVLGAYQQEIARRSLRAPVATTARAT